MESKEQTIINEYTNGKSISQIVREYNFTRHSVEKTLRENNVAIRGGRKKKTLNEEQLKTIQKMLDEGAILKDMAQAVNLDRETLTLRLQELNMKPKNHNKVNRCIKSDFFSVIDSHEKAYWLGFLFTDGSVDNYKANCYRIRLQIQAQDKELLYKYKESLGLGSKITKDDRSKDRNSICYSVEFCDKQIFDDLAKYGIVPRKTYEVDRIPYEQIPREYWNSYALGLLDGDGSINIPEDNPSQCKINYTAYHQTETEDFKNLIQQISGIDTSASSYFTSAWHVQIGGRRQVLQILDCLYRDCPIYLARKYDKYIKIKSNLTK